MFCITEGVPVDRIKIRGYALPAFVCPWTVRMCRLMIHGSSTACFDIVCVTYVLLVGAEVAGPTCRLKIVLRWHRFCFARNALWLAQPHGIAG